MQHRMRTAITLALVAAVISGTANHITKAGVTVVSDPVVFTLLKNGLVAVVLIGLLGAGFRFRELRMLSRHQWISLIVIGIVGGSVPFVLFFTGLQQTGAITASFIHKTLFIWVALFAAPFLKEHMSKGIAAGLVLLLGGNILLGFPSFTFSPAEWMILGATILWAAENIIAKKALHGMSSFLVGSARMTFGSVILLGLVALQGHLPMMVGLSSVQWGWTALGSLFLAGYVLVWYTALKYAPATLVACLLVPASLVTNVLSMAQNGELSWRTLGSAVLVLVALGVLIRQFLARTQKDTTVTAEVT